LLGEYRGDFDIRIEKEGKRNGGRVKVVSGLNNMKAANFLRVIS